MFLISAITIALLAQEQPSARFVDVPVGSATLRIPFPVGFCLPKGEVASGFQVLAAGDTRNVTLVTLVSCDADDRLNRYLVVKAPIRALNLDLALPATIAELAAEMEGPDFQSTVQDATEQVGADKTAQFGVATSVAGGFGPRGHDDRCVYLGGQMTTKMGEDVQTQGASTCVTVAGNRLITLNSYEDSVDPLTYRRLAKEMRSWSLKITVAPPTR